MKGFYVNATTRNCDYKRFDVQTSPRSTQSPADSASENPKLRNRTNSRCSALLCSYPLPSHYSLYVRLVV